MTKTKINEKEITRGNLSKKCSWSCCNFFTASESHENDVQKMRERVVEVRCVGEEVGASRLFGMHS